MFLKNRLQLGDYLEWTHEFKSRDQEFTIAGHRLISNMKTEETYASGSVVSHFVHSKEQYHVLHH